MSIKVKLQRFQDSDLIIAPDFCPYRFFKKHKEGSQEGAYVVPPSFCPLCKRCEFVTEFAEDGIFKEEEQKIVKYFKEFNTKIANSISGQFLYLSKEKRLPLIILISVSILEQCLQYVCGDNKKRIEELKNFIFSNEIPICHIFHCPVILSPKLTKTPVMVVGEIEWK